MAAYTKLEYTVSFVTPAFLGGAEQAAEWRTPPFKALLREWWRVVKAPDVGYNVERLKEAEHKLFGHAGDSKNSSQSKVRLRLGHWGQGTELGLHVTLKDERLSTGKFRPPAAVYLGYGPVENNKSRPAISSLNDKNTFSVLIRQDNDVEELRKAIQLAAWFGAIGSRSRNSWGSLSIKGTGLKDTYEISARLLSDYLRNWEDCLERDWPHAIGKDDKGPLIWRTAVHNDWKGALRNIADLRSTIRGQFRLNQSSRELQDRHILAYPIKEPAVNAWEKDARFPNQLRLKIVCENGKYRGMVTHVPCALPQHLVATLPPQKNGDVKNRQIRVWKQTHTFLDELSRDPSKKLTRIT